MTAPDPVVTAARELRDAAEDFEDVLLSGLTRTKTGRLSRAALVAAMQAMQRALEQEGEGCVSPPPTADAKGGVG